MQSRKIKYFSFSVFYNKTEFCEKNRNDIQKRFILEIEKDLFCEMKRPLSTKERIEMGIFKILRCFSRM